MYNTITGDKQSGDIMNHTFGVMGLMGLMYLNETDNRLCNTWPTRVVLVFIGLK